LILPRYEFSILSFSSEESTDNPAPPRSEAPVASTVNLLALIELNLNFEYCCSATAVTVK